MTEKNNRHRFRSLSVDETKNIQKKWQFRCQA